MGDSRGSVAVVGAGPAGLAAAWRLAASGRRVVVYEARPEAGGRLRTEVVGGAGADVVVQLLSAGYDRLHGLLREMGVADRLVEVPGRDALWRGGTAHALRYGSMTRMALSGALPARLKVRMGLRYVPFLERHASVLDLNDLSTAAAAGLDGESIAEWGAREVGEEFVELLVYPLLAAYYGVTPEETSAAVFHALAHAGMDVTIQGVRGGAGALADAMAASLRSRGVELRPGRPVESLASSSDGVSLVAGGEGAEHAAAVVAVPPRSAARLVPGAPWLSTVTVRSTATLVLAVDGPARPGWFGLSIPRTEPPGGVIAAVCAQPEKETGLGSPERGTLVVVPTPGEGERWAEAEPREALARALPAVERILPGVSGGIVEARLVRLDGAVFVPTPGHFDRVRRLDPAGLPARLALAGDYLVAPTVEGAVRAGLAAADRLAAVE